MNKSKCPAKLPHAYITVLIHTTNLKQNGTISSAVAMGG